MTAAPVLCEGRRTPPRFPFYSPNLLEGVFSDTLSFRDVRVVVGTTVLTSGQGQERRIARLSDISIRPRLTLRNQAHDVAVIKLARPVNDIKPIGLAPVGSDAYEGPGRLSTVAEWGSVLAVPLRSIRSRGSSSPCLIHKVRGSMEFSEVRIAPVRHL